MHSGRAEMIIRKDHLQVDRGTAEDEQRYGARESLHLTEEGRLTQFVAHVHTLHPGDAACWPAGTANAHQVVNRSGEPCTYLIFGSGAVPDVVHSPERG